MRYYITKNRKLKGSFNAPQVLEEGEKELVSATEIKKYHFDVNDNLIDDTTQADTDAQTLSTEQQNARNLFLERKKAGKQIIEDALAWMEHKATSSSSPINQSNYDNTVDAVENILAPLTTGRRNSFESVRATLISANLTGLKSELRDYIVSLIDAN